jgi:hypothetical protein
LTSCTFIGGGKVSSSDAFLVTVLDDLQNQSAKQIQNRGKLTDRAMWPASEVLEQLFHPKNTASWY